MTTVLITGASRGLGATAARRLAALGLTVLAGTRTPSTCSPPAGSQDPRGGPDALDLRLLELDVTDDVSVAAAVREVEQSVGTIDVLVNNAGIPGTWAAAPEVGPADFRDVFETNVFAPVRVTQAFLPLLRRSHRPRLVMVSSGKGSLTLQTCDEVYQPIAHLPYPASKAALNMLTVQYAKGLPDVLVTAIDPGLTATDFTNHVGQTVEEGTDALVAAVLDTTGPSGRFLDRHGSTPW